MAMTSNDRGSRSGSRWRIARWGGAALLLLLPLLAMQFSDEMKWDETDFIVLGAMLTAACGAYELGAWLSRNAAYRAAVGVAVAAAFLLIWLNLAVGIIGSEDNPANLMYAGVLAVALAGAIVARGESSGMARALTLTALGRHDEAMQAALASRRGMGFTPTWLVGYVHARAGRLDDAREVLRAVQARAATTYVPPVEIAFLEAAVGNQAAALDGLERGGYVERGLCDTDRRVVYAVLTDTGLRKVREASASHVAQIDELFGEYYDADELVRMETLLTRLGGSRRDDCAPDA